MLQALSKKAAFVRGLLEEFVEAAGVPSFTEELTRLAALDSPELRQVTH
jgi:hypothetical protein